MYDRLLVSAVTFKRSLLILRCAFDFFTQADKFVSNVKIGTIESKLLQERTNLNDNYSKTNTCIGLKLGTYS